MSPVRLIEPSYQISFNSISYAKSKSLNRTHKGEINIKFTETSPCQMLVCPFNTASLTLTEPPCGPSYLPLESEQC